MWITLYEAPLAMEQEHLAQVACECLHLPCPEPDLTDWTEMVNNAAPPDNRKLLLHWLENTSSFTTLIFPSWRH